ncbi:MAG: DUF1800 family protein, partial [Bdellovibrionales bacterium]|nr:DUF1800 family protein [Bdellovibrionales bacterium]
MKSTKGGYRFVSYSTLAKKLRATSKKKKSQKALYKRLAKLGAEACIRGGSPNPGETPGTPGETPDEETNFSLKKFSGSYGLREAQILYSRFAFGATHEELARSVQIGLDATVNELLSWKDESSLEAEAKDIECDRYRAVEDTYPNVGENKPNRTCNRLDPTSFDLTGLQDSYYWRILNTPNPFFYKFMTFIHSDRLSAQIDTLPQSRRHFARQHFEFLMEFARNLDYGWYVRNVKDDALVAYHNLDLGENSVFNELTPPNENFAREWLELCTMSPEAADGTPNYGVLDMIELAAALSGRGYNVSDVPVGDVNNDGEMDTVRIESPALIDNAFIKRPKTLFIGTPFQTSIMDADDAADAILSHPETYYHMAEEIVREFIAS